jgi:hypothetical protein
MQPEDDPKPDPTLDDPKPDDPPDDDPAPDDDPKPDDKPTLGDAGKAAIDRMKRDRNAALKELKDLREQVKKFQDKDKSEAQRLAESAEEAKGRAAQLETSYRKLTTAMERAPEGATLAQIRAVAKRLSGDTEEELEADADELFQLLAPKPATDEGKRAAPAGKPTPNLRGGGNPEEEPEEMDPRKLAGLIGRP